MVCNCAVGLLPSLCGFPPLLEKGSSSLTLKVSWTGSVAPSTRNIVGVTLCDIYHSSWFHSLVSWFWLCSFLVQPGDKWMQGLYLFLLLPAHLQLNCYFCCFAVFARSGSEPERDLSHPHLSCTLAEDHSLPLLNLKEVRGNPQAKGLPVSRPWLPSGADLTYFCPVPAV